METLQEFSGRLPRKGMKLVKIVKGLVHTFWHDNTMPSFNTKDVLKHCRGSINNEPHVKHYLHMKQTELFEMFKVFHAKLRLGKISFKNPSLGMLESIPSRTLFVVYTTYSLVYILIHLHIYIIFFILTMCRNAQVQYRQCHLDISSIP